MRDMALLSRSTSTINLQTSSPSSQQALHQNQHHQLRQTSNVTTTLPSITSLPSSAAWMVNNNPIPSLVCQDTVASKINHKAAVCAPLENAHDWHPQNIIRNNDAYNRLITGRCLNYQYYMQSYLPAFNQYLEEQQSKTFLPPDCHQRQCIHDIRRIINRNDNAADEVRKNAARAFQEYKSYINDTAETIDEQSLQKLIEQIAILCDPTPKNLENIRRNFSIAYTNATAMKETYQFWIHLLTDKDLVSYLSTSNPGREVLTEAEEIMESDVDCYTEFTSQQILFIDKVFSLLQPFSIMHSHQLCDINLKEKDTETIIQTLLNNQGINETLKESQYGTTLWHELKTVSLAMNVLKFRKKGEHAAQEINAEKMKLSRRQAQQFSLNPVNFVINRWKNYSINKKTEEHRFRQKIRENVILNKNSFFSMLDRLQHAGVNSTLSELMKKDPTLINDISVAVSLSETAKKLTPDLLSHPAIMQEFATVASYLSICNELVRNIANPLQAINLSVQNYYHDMSDIAAQLNDDGDNKLFILAAGLFLPPDISHQDRKVYLMGLSQVLKLREETSLSMTEDGIDFLQENGGQWENIWQGCFDDNTSNAIINTCFSNNEIKQQNAIFTQIEEKLTHAIKDYHLEIFSGEAIYRNDNMMNKLNMSSEQKEQLRKAITDDLFTQQQNSDSLLQSAKFRIKVASITGLSKEKLAYDLKKINLTSFHYQQKHVNTDDILITEKHLEKIDHLLVWQHEFDNLLFDLNDVHQCVCEFNLISTWLNTPGKIDEMFFDMQSDTQSDNIDDFSDYSASESGSSFFPIESERDKWESQETLATISGDDATPIQDLHQRVSRIMNNNNIGMLSLLKPEIENRLLYIKNKLLSFSDENIKKFFHAIKETGIYLNLEDQQALQNKITSILLDADNTEEISSRTMLSHVLHTLFSTKKIIELPDNPLKGHKHEYQHALATRLLKQLSQSVNKEYNIILSSLDSAPSGKADYFDACCQLLTNPQKNSAILSALMQKESQSIKLNTAERNELNNNLSRMLSATPAIPDTDINKVIDKLRAHRNERHLVILASLTIWYDFLRKWQEKYTEINKNAPDVNNIASLAARELTDKIKLHSLKYLHKEFDNYLKKNKDTLPDAVSFIQSVNSDGKITDSTAYQISMLQDYIQNLESELQKNHHKEYKKALREQGDGPHFSGIELLMAMMAYESHRVKEISDRQSRIEEIKRDWPEFNENIDIQSQIKNIEIENKYILRKNQVSNMELILEANALAREYDWYNKNLAKSNRGEQGFLKYNFNTSKTSRYLDFLHSHEKVYYLVFEVIPGDIHTRVAINDRSHPAPVKIRGEQHPAKAEAITIKDTIAITPAEHEKLYTYVPVKARDFTDSTVEDLIKHKLPPKTTESREYWKRGDEKTKLPEIFGCRLMKIVVEDTGHREYHFVKAVDKKEDIPAFVSPSVFDIKAKVEELKNTWLHNPHRHNDPTMLNSRTATNPADPQIGPSSSRQPVAGLRAITTAEIASSSASPTVAEPLAVISKSAAVMASAPAFTASSSVAVTSLLRPETTPAVSAVPPAQPVAINVQSAAVPPSPLINNQGMNAVIAGNNVPAPDAHSGASQQSVTSPVKHSQRQFFSHSHLAATPPSAASNASVAAPAFTRSDDGNSLKEKMLSRYREKATQNLARKAELKTRYPFSAVLIEHIDSRDGWRESSFDFIPWLISRTPLYRDSGITLVITSMTGEITNAFDASSGENISLADWVAAKRPFAAIRRNTSSDEHYDAWLPGKGQKHSVSQASVPSAQPGQPARTAHYIDKKHSRIYPIARSGFCLMEAAVCALNLPPQQAQSSRSELRNQLIAALSSGEHEAMLAQRAEWKEQD